MSPYYDAPMVDDDARSRCDGYLTDVLADVAIAFVRDEAQRPEPFWLSLNYTAPHYPWID